MKKIFSILSILCAAFFVASCVSDSELEATEGGEGYLRIQVETNVNTITRAMDVPEDYVPKKLHVAIMDSNNETVMESDYENGEFSNSAFSGSVKLNAGTYTIVAHSANWDGSQSAFNAPYYVGQSEVTIERKTSKTATVTCKLANVKVTVNFDDNFKKYFTSAKSEVSSSLNDVVSRTFVMNQPNGSAYFPAADLTFTVTVNDDPSKSQTNTVTDVQPRDHYIINYHVGDPTGEEGTIKVYIDDATNTYTYNILVSTVGSKVDLKANAASNMSADAFDGTTVTLSGSGEGEDLAKDKVVMQYRKKGASEWTTVAHDQLTVTDTEKGANFSCTLTTLEAAVAYEYRLAQVDEQKPSSGDAVEFTIKGADIYNGGFEYWYENSDNSTWYANEAGVTYWDSSNPGSASMGRNVTTKTTSVVHGGSAAAQLASTYIVIKFAAASLYTGSFDHLVGTKGAVLNWGVPFTGRPISLHGFMQYAPGAVNRVNSSAPSTAPAKNEDDICQIYCALTTEVIQVDNTNIDTTFPNWETDSRVIAYGSLPESECVNSNGQWKEFNIPFEYHNTVVKPSYLIVVCSASKYGDYFHGSDKSVLYLDDFELSYAGTPTVKQ